MNKLCLLGRLILSDWAISKSKFCRKLEVSLAKNEQSDKDDKHPSGDVEKGNVTVNTPRKVEITSKNNFKKQKNEKLQKEKRQKKRARIIVRNLSFQVFVLFVIKSIISDVADLYTAVFSSFIK